MRLPGQETVEIVSEQEKSFSPQGQKSSSTAGIYQRKMPITRKDIGQDYLKSSSKYEPHQGSKEVARRLKQQAKAAAKANSMEQEQDQEPA